MSEEEDEFECDATCDRCSECADDTWNVVVKMNKAGQIVDEQSWCENCYDEHAFFCHASDFNFSEAGFTRAENIDGDVVCREYVAAKGWKKTHERDANSGDYTVFLSPDTAREEQVAQDNALKEGKTMFVDFYWRFPTPGKKSPTPENPRVLVLMQEDGKEVSSESSAGVAEIVKAISKKAKDAGANIGDNHTLNVYTRLQLIEGKHLPATYKL